MGGGEYHVHGHPIVLKGQIKKEDEFKISAIVI